MMSDPNIEKIAGLPRALANIAKKYSPFFPKSPTPRIKQHLFGRDAAKDLATHVDHSQWLPIGGRQGKKIKAQLPQRLPLGHKSPWGGDLRYDTSATHGGKKHWRPAHLPGYSFADRVKAYKKLKHEGGGPQTILTGDKKRRKSVSKKFLWSSSGTKGSDWGTQTPGTKYIQKALGGDAATKFSLPGDSPTAIWARRKTKELRDAGAPSFKTQLPPPKRSIFQRAKARLLPPPKLLTPAEMQSTLRPPAITSAGERNLLRLGSTPGELGIGGHKSKYTLRPAPWQYPASIGRYGGDLPKDLQKKLRTHRRLREKAQVLRERKEAGEISPQLNRYLGGEAHKKLVKRIREDMRPRKGRNPDSSGMPGLLEREDLAKYYYNEPPKSTSGGAGFGETLFRLFLGV